jgi:hypothetical protein
MVNGLMQEAQRDPPCERRKRAGSR